jgi:EAL domain-containing protein (putative c-di-GMP-specific phosphodiesterase class I)
MDNTGVAAAMLSRLRTLGIELVMDDFGIGYTSLSQLHRLPFTALKIDRSFVSTLELDSGTADIVRAIFTLAQNLKVPVTAEGVETRAQLAKLRELGANRAQGNLFSKPLNPNDVEKLLADPPRW